MIDDAALLLAIRCNSLVVRINYVRVRLKRKSTLSARRVHVRAKPKKRGPVAASKFTLGDRVSVIFAITFVVARNRAMTHLHVADDDRSISYITFDVVKFT